MKHSRAHRLGLSLLLLTLTGCGWFAKPPQVAVAATPIPTPVPATDVLAYIRSGQFWVMRWNGSEAKPLVASAQQSFWFPSPAISGTHFLAWLSRPDGSQNVVRVDIDGSVTELTNFEERALPQMKNLRLANAPVYTPDGTKITYSFNGNIWIMDANGMNPETLISDGNSWSPSWSPDGKQLAYVNGRQGHYDLWLTEARSKDSMQLTDFKEYTVGQPRWTGNGEKIMLTRWQRDESDIVTVPSGQSRVEGEPVTFPLFDSNGITKDRLSSGANFSPDGLKLIMSSARGDGLNLEVWISDVLGSEARQLTQGGAYSPAWLRPGTATAMVSAPSRPTPVIAATPLSAVASVAASPTGKALLGATSSTATANTAHTGASSSANVTSLPHSTPLATPVQVKALPTAEKIVGVVGVTKTALNPSQTAVAIAVPIKTKVPANGVIASLVPTAAPPKAAPLRLKVKASFDETTDNLTLASLTSLNSAARRVKQYAGEGVLVYGPLDRTPLKARYASNEERSQARAKQVAAALAKAAGLEVKSVQAMPYAPPTAGGGGPANSIQIYVEIK